MEFQIPKNHELRIEILETQKIKVMVTVGLAEIFGQELLNEKWYVFSHDKFGIFTFTGAVVRIDGECSMHYITEHTNVPQTFSYFDTVKDTHKTVLVLGKGRSTFCANIANYFVRIHKKVDFVEIDPSKGNIFPGALSYMQIETLIDCNEKMKLNNPFCFYYGALSIDNQELYEIQVKKLADELKNRSKGNFKLVICPNASEEIISEISKCFEADEIVCLGDERLFHRLNLAIPKTFITNTAYIHENNISRSINRYFNGSNGEFTPSSFILRNEYNIVRFGEQYAAPESALPLGASRKVGYTDVCKCDLVQNSVLAISEADSEDKIATSPVSGFLVCVDEKKSRILCCQPKLPRCKYLIQGSLKFVEF